MSSVKQRYYLGIDVGSSGVKVIVVSEAGEPRGTADSAYDIHYPRPGFVEQNSEDWYRAACSATRRVLKTANIVDGRQVAGIGLSGTSHVPSMLDANYKPVRRAILWNDLRSGDQVMRLTNHAGEPIRAKTQNSINCTWSLPQLAWVREHEPEVFARVRHVLFSKDYLTYRLTGELAADPGSAVSSLLVDARTLQWDADLLELAGLDPTYVAPIRSCTEIVGALARDAAVEMGLRAGLPVVAGMLDSAAELVGVGAAKPAVAVIRLGTAGGVMTVTDRAEWRHGCLLYPHPIEPAWFYQAGTNSAAASLRWVSRLLQLDRGDGGYAALDALVQRSSPGADGLLFHPYLLGERAPYWNGNLKGGFNGITINHGPAEFVRAVQEGVAYSLRDCARLLDWKGVSRVRLCGGGTKSPAWCRIIADVLGLPVERMLLPDASAFGAALAAISGCTNTDLAAVVAIAVHTAGSVEPDTTLRHVYDAGFGRYVDIAVRYIRTLDEELRTESGLSRLLKNLP